MNQLKLTENDAWKMKDPFCLADLAESTQTSIGEKLCSFINRGASLEVEKEDDHAIP